MDLLLFGIQGSGKGTQAKRLAEAFGFDIFEAGGELRKIAADGSELGQTVKSYIDQGKLVPHGIIMQVVKEAIQKRPAGQRILFDGIPRDGDQQKDFDAVMKEVGRDFRAIHLLLDPEEGVQRILGRAKIEGRADDANEETIRRRMKTFVEKTMPVIESYKEEGRVVEVDGKRSMDEVYGALEGIVRKLG
ncbi:MAG: nucleoside monophosphate kinase [Candidatus Peribacteraceae bacterium]|jgi:adenylate kinase